MIPDSDYTPEELSPDTDLPRTDGPTETDPSPDVDARAAMDSPLLEVPRGYRSGFISIVGKPNVGKSTLLNQLVGLKISIVSPKAQTTRRRILGILSGEGYQIVFGDTPGILRPRYRLQEAMMASVRRALEDADLILLMTAMDSRFDHEQELLGSMRGLPPVLLVVNKIDLTPPQHVQQRIEQVRQAVEVRDFKAVSALEGFNLEGVIGMILDHLPEGPPYFAPDQLTDRTERFLVSEIIREKIFLHYEQEIPYSTEVTILLYEEREHMVYIEAEIHVERRNQKSILIGKGGVAIRQIGIEARKDIEALIGQKTFLKLYVRVAEHWKDREAYVRRFGYQED